MKKRNPNPNSISQNPKKKFKKDDDDNNKGKWRPGPRLPSSLRQELDLLNPNLEAASTYESDGYDAAGASEDLYEYEEGLAQEETKKNRRFDPVENYEYELPIDFKVRSSSSNAQIFRLPGCFFFFLGI